MNILFSEAIKDQNGSYTRGCQQRFNSFVYISEPIATMKNIKKKEKHIERAIPIVICDFIHPLELFLL